MVFIGPYSSALLCPLLGVGLPGYDTFKTLNAASTDAAKTTGLLTYWLVFALLAVASPVLDLVLSWLPLYYEAKVGFIVWLQYKSGATLLFQRFLQPLLAPHVGTIDETAKFLMRRAKSLKVEDAKDLYDFVCAKAQGLAAPAAPAPKPYGSSKPMAESPSATALTGSDDKEEEEVIFDDAAVEIIGQEKAPADKKAE